MFARLVELFYDGVAGDPELRALYPEEDLRPAQQRLTMFLEQYWGGPSTYSEQRGHPRLGMRHAPFAVTPLARDRWLTHMRHAVQQMEMPPERAEEFWAYVLRAAHFLVNTTEDERAPGTSGASALTSLPLEPTGPLAE